MFIDDYKDIRRQKASKGQIDKKSGRGKKVNI